MPTLEKFDPSRPLVAKTYFRFHGVIYTKGKSVTYDEADHRVLERLYTLRKIGYGEGEAVELTTPQERFLSGNSERRQQAKPKEDETDPNAPTAEEQPLVDKLVRDNTHDDLFTKASGLAGVTKTMKKAEIALALVRAGRGPA